ncbi:aspartate/glutamate racemase family protein [Halomonas dongshanensis]|uniref:Aspartate/glutamate racemase family protein n=1 Tax=Halomonas dongshanensis TaxID=2890835 RepID=A0ABT2EGL6_9GAMM|nr:aspartate/glutamate racemase family protein [Halomonas dongshanensis]MCS2610701.1 aspartate/glutamate racemase family protein [Halomonas dongshanensis]
MTTDHLGGASPGATQRILVINPNTNTQVTREIGRLVEQHALNGLHIDVTNPRTGPLAIENATDKAAATREVMALIKARQSVDYAGCIMACFDDLAVREARELTRRPVVSLAEAGMRAAGGHGLPFTVITTFDGAVETIHSLSRDYGIDAHCRIVATGIGVSETAARTPRAEKRLHDAIVASLEQGARAIVLGSGAFVGQAAPLSKRYGVEITDGISDAIHYVCSPLLAKFSK